MSRFRGAAAITLAVIAGGCGGSEPSRPVVGPPARIEVVTKPPASAAVASVAGSLGVLVTDAAGAAVSGVTVTFAATGAVASPATAITGDDGTAATSVALDTVAGPAQVTAAVNGSAITAVYRLSATPGSLARLIISPDTIKLRGLGDTVRLQLTARDRYANKVTIADATFASLDPAIARVDITGLVRAAASGGGTSVIATSAGFADTVPVSVIAADTTGCRAGIARGMAVGETATFAVTDTPCLSGSIAGAEFGLVAWNGDWRNAASLTVRGDGLGIVVSPPSPSLSVSDAATLARVPQPDEAFRAALLARNRSLAQFIPAARRWRATSGAGNVSGFQPARSLSVIPSAVRVGDLLRFNVNEYSACSSPEYRTARVMAVSQRAVVLADTLNPAGGFTSADYASFAAQFDTVVFPVDSSAFGAPTDIDGNGRIGMLFTSYVNGLTPRGSHGYVGGYFFGRDLLPATGTQGCAGSNEGEMFYLLAPDPNGMVSDPRAADFVRSTTASTIAHELQHLINTSRRIYVNSSATGFEDVWLDEGLSHVAEELLFYRESGLAPRRNLDDASIRASAPVFAAWTNDQRQNTLRFGSYLESPRPNGPVADNDELATRGATWSFLRFAADHLYAQDGDLWYRLVNSGTSGLATLRAGYAVDPLPLIRDWAVSNLLDDAGVGSDPRFGQPSWNMRDVFAHLSGIGRYPLAVTPLADGGTESGVVGGTTAAYYRFTIPAGSQARLTFGAPGTPDPGTLQFVVTRTR